MSKEEDKEKQNEGMGREEETEGGAEELLEELEKEMED